MRVLTLILISLATACTTESEPTAPSCDSLGVDPSMPLACTATGDCTYKEQACQRAPRNTLADRKDLCGSAPVEPELDPAIETDSSGEDFVILYPSHWDADAAYMNASKAWADCMVYAQPIGN